MTPGRLGAILLLGFMWLLLRDWLTPAKVLTPFDEGAAMASKGILCIVGVAFIAYHLVVYRKYHDDNHDMDGDRPEAILAKKDQPRRSRRNSRRG